MIGAFLNTFVPKVWEVIAQAHGLKFEIKLDIDYIEEELPFVDDCIRKHILHCVSPSLEVSQVIKKARRLAEDTEQCISRFLLYQTHVRHSLKMSHAQFALQIKDLRGKLEQIKNDVSSLEQGPTICPEEPEDHHFGKHQFVGMGIPRQELLELLEPTPPGDLTGKLKVISIVGFGGSGKTRLAKKVCEEAGSQFDPQAWVHMGPHRNVNEVLKEILKTVSTGVQHLVGGASGASIDDVKEGLKSRLANKRYLIVIDDVRSADGWDALMDALSGSNVGSRIIATTTIQAVAERCSNPSGHVYKMTTLSYEDSEKLFLNAFGEELSDARKNILTTLLKACDGLPLAVTESAEFLKGQQVGQVACQKAIRKLSTPEETLTRMQWVLMKKYSSLANYGARACLLYFHMFPFENPTKGKFLTRRWLAEGLVQRDDTNCSDLDAASNYLRIFRDSNIIRSMQASNNATVKSCTLPGTMHQFISHQCVSQDFVTFLCHGNNKPYEPRFVRRLSLRDDTANSRRCIEDVHVSLLRTLAVSGEACNAVMDFSQYELLRVLDLKECDYKLSENKLEAICKLVMLKYLGLPASISEVPREIGHLIHLETLDVGETAIVMVYGEVIMLPKLKHLLGKFRLSTRDNPENYVPDDSRLETLSGFVTNRSEAFPKLMKHMKSLRKVKMWCDFKAVRTELKHLSVAIKDFIRQGNAELGDRSLSIDVTGCQVLFLDSLEADPGRLTKLKLHGGLKKVPKFLTPQRITGMQELITPLNGLTELCLSMTTLCGGSSLFPFPMVAGAWLLPYLTYLKLVEDELGPLHILPMHFPSLERICLVGKKSINSITIADGALQYLVSLHVMCEHLDGLAGIQIGGLKRLKEIILDSKVTQTADVAHPGIKSTKDTWKDAARSHPNTPRILFVEAATKP